MARPGHLPPSRWRPLVLAWHWPRVPPRTCRWAPSARGAATACLQAAATAVAPVTGRRQLHLGAHFQRCCTPAALDRAPRLAAHPPLAAGMGCDSGPLPLFNWACGLHAEAAELGRQPPGGAASLARIFACKQRGRTLCRSHAPPRSSPDRRAAVGAGEPPPDGRPSPPCCARLPGLLGLLLSFGCV